MKSFFIELAIGAVLGAALGAFVNYASYDRVARMIDKAKTEAVSKALDKAFEGQVEKLFQVALAPLSRIDNTVRGIDLAWGIREELRKHYGIDK